MKNLDKYRSTASLIYITLLNIALIISFSCTKCEDNHYLDIDIPPIGDCGPALAFDAKGRPNWLPTKCGIQNYSPTNIIRVYSSTSLWKAVHNVSWMEIIQHKDHVEIVVYPENADEIPDQTDLLFTISGKTYAICTIHLIKGGDEVFRIN